MPGETTGYNGGTYDAAEPNDRLGRLPGLRPQPLAQLPLLGRRISTTSPSPAPASSTAKASASAPSGDRAATTPASSPSSPASATRPSLSKTATTSLLRDFSILKGGHFGLLATGVDNLTIDNLIIDTDRDGIDIDCCQNVRVSNCTVNSPWDDGICPKSSYALGYARPTDNVTISNNYVTGYYDLGTVLDGTWKKFPTTRTSRATAASSAAPSPTAASATSPSPATSSKAAKASRSKPPTARLLEDITITGNTMRDLVDAPLFLRLNRRNRGPKDTMRPGTAAPRHHLQSRQLQLGPSTASILSGIPENLIEDVKLSNCYFGHHGLPTDMKHRLGRPLQAHARLAHHRVPEIEDAYPELLRFGPTPSNGFFIRHLKNLEMSHVEIAPATPDPRPAFWLEDVHRADFFAITAPRSPTSPCTMSPTSASSGAAPPRTPPSQT